LIPAQGVDEARRLFVQHRLILLALRDHAARRLEARGQLRIVQLSHRVAEFQLLALLTGLLMRLLHLDDQRAQLPVFPARFGLERRRLKPQRGRSRRVVVHDAGMDGRSDAALELLRLRAIRLDPPLLLSNSQQVLEAGRVHSLQPVLNRRGRLAGLVQSFDDLHGKCTPSVCCPRSDRRYCSQRRRRLRGEAITNISSKAAPDQTIRAVGSAVPRRFVRFRGGRRFRNDGLRRVTWLW
jgi:hypothetical protein